MHELQSYRATDVCAFAADHLGDLTGVIDPNPPPRKRYAGMPADEALAVSQLRRYGYDKRCAHLGKAAGDLAQRGRPGTNSTNRYDARLVRVVDFGRALSSMSNIDSTLVQMYYSDGESLTLISQATGVSVRTLSSRLPIARRALLNALEAFNLV